MLTTSCNAVDQTPVQMLELSEEVRELTSCACVGVVVYPIPLTCGRECVVQTGRFVNERFDRFKAAKKAALNVSNQL